MESELDRLASAEEIRRLMYRYAELVDAARFDEVGELFAHARITAGNGEDEGDGDLEVAAGRDAVADLYRNTNKVHPDGTLRTRHLTTNVSVEVDVERDEASARSTFVVLQAAERVPLQPIVAGRYRDRFERVDGAWRFAERCMLVDAVGDVSEHLTIDLDQH